jgi:hypothetical protein
VRSNAGLATRAARDGRLEEEGWRIRKDGTRFWANVIITALRGQKSELLGFAKVTRRARSSTMDFVSRTPTRARSIG